MPLLWRSCLKLAPGQMRRMRNLAGELHPLRCFVYTGVLIGSCRSPSFTQFPPCCKVKRQPAPAAGRACTMRCTGVIWALRPGCWRLAPHCTCQTTRWVGQRENDSTLSAQLER